MISRLTAGKSCSSIFGLHGVNPAVTRCLRCGNSRRSSPAGPFVVMAVNLAESESKVNDFLSRFPLDFTMLLDRNSEAKRAWNVKVLPTSFVVAPDGKIRYSVVGDVNWADDTAVKDVLRLVPVR